MREKPSVQLLLYKFLRFSSKNHPGPYRNMGTIHVLFGFNHALFSKKKLLFIFQ
jgi:hypothetical protein